jgi:hypothetical protein
MVHQAVPTEAQRTTTTTNITSMVVRRHIRTSMAGASSILRLLGIRLGMVDRRVLIRLSRDGSKMRCLDGSRLRI